MTIERLDEEVRLPLNIPAIMSGDEKRLADYMTELINELQRIRIFDIHQRINLLIDLSAGPVIYLGLKDSTGAYPSGTWRLNGTSATEYLVQLMVGTTWTTMATISSGGVLTITDITVSTPSLIYALSHDSFADFVAAEHIDWSVTGAEVIHDDRIAESSVTQHEGAIDHDALTNTHNLTTDIDHDQLTNTHNLTTDIDHDQLTNVHQDVNTTASPEFVGLTTTGGRIVNTTRIISTDSPYAVLVTDHVIDCDTDGGAITVNLLPGVEGTQHRIINCGSSGNNVTVDGDAAEAVCGELTQVLYDDDVIDLVYNATEGWR